jgi:hypothetical protein
MSIPYMESDIQALPVPENTPEPSSRAELIQSLPSYLKVVLSSPTGLNLVNIGTSEPSPEHRNKPWLSTNAVNAATYPRGIYIWDEDAADWIDIAPVDVAELVRNIQLAKEVATDAEEDSIAAEADADAAKQYATNAQTAADASDVLADAAEDAAENAADEHSGVYYGYVDDDPAWRTPQAIQGAWTSDWINLTGVPELATTPLPVGFLTLKADNYPQYVFRYGMQIQTVGGVNQARIVGYNYFDGSPADRRVDWMWMVKGELA